ncbi:MAG TPA: DCC1-like thiol-disulfide oxidoreductase family protein [Dehalococcoidia bacterium]|nr:DCC1-like thiol-disulfide oxidoreductase family protein [Dehalococcoidia bacterium]
MTSSRPPRRAVIIYDASCALCSRSANFVAARDRVGRFRYGGVASIRARELLAEHGIDPVALDAVALVDAEGAYTGSTAALRVLSALPLPWRLLGVLRFVPVPIREPLYRFVARNRHRFTAGRACPAPHPRLLERLIS